ncbi:MAG: hypothetical protein MPJ52_00405 [Alphaproteobacteria bacterium]|nr:hypothetical protein [Alphaproteobacteria bacterium]
METITASPSLSPSSLLLTKMATTTASPLSPLSSPSSSQFQPPPHKGEKP